MPTLDLNGIEVDFPFEPYACQVNYMKSVIESISKVNYKFLKEIQEVKL
jgi:hypothetical protein